MENPPNSPLRTGELHARFSLANRGDLLVLPRAVRKFTAKSWYIAFGVSTPALGSNDLDLSVLALYFEPKGMLRYDDRTARSGKVAGIFGRSGYES